MILKQKYIHREDLKANRHVLYLFGDNLARYGYGGQAAEMRGEPNAVGVATKNTPKRTPDAYFYDTDFAENARIIANDLRKAFNHVRSGGIVVIPLDGLGTGLSQLSSRAPKTNRFLLELLDKLEKGVEPSWKQILNG